MTRLPPAWDIPPGEERCTTVRATTKNPRWTLYECTLSDGTPFVVMGRTPEIARMKRDLELERRCMTVPKPELRLRQERVPASECDDPRCCRNWRDGYRWNERGVTLEATA